ncbi:exported hypothetical protein [Actinacidiphila cocklensis]|uniref:Uncharacterized protein n=1 Tax=Actinacidiphila cocklensis TaxID=887465 RepID=A0A9W4DG20_9ACTN|nr:exported hypothetical protein [Actinacidiphila cocklensis]
MTAVSGRAARILCTARRPSASWAGGMRMSVMTTSGRCSPAARTRSTALSTASTTSMPALPSTAAMPSRTIGWSSPSTARSGWFMTAAYTCAGFVYTCTSPVCRRCVWGVPYRGAWESRGSTRERTTDPDALCPETERWIRRFPAAFIAAEQRSRAFRAPSTDMRRRPGGAWQHTYEGRSTGRVLEEGDHDEVPPLAGDHPVGDPLPRPAADVRALVRHPGPAGRRTRLGRHRRAPGALGLLPGPARGGPDLPVGRGGRGAVAGVRPRRQAALLLRPGGRPAHGAVRDPRGTGRDVARRDLHHDPEGGGAERGRLGRAGAAGGMTCPSGPPAGRPQRPRRLRPDRHHYVFQPSHTCAPGRNRPSAGEEGRPCETDDAP